MTRRKTRAMLETINYPKLPHDRLKVELERYVGASLSPSTNPSILC